MPAPAIVRQGGRSSVQRLARLYVRHFRAELIRRREYMEAAARRVLMGTA